MKTTNCGNSFVGDRNSSGSKTLVVGKTARRSLEELSTRIFESDAYHAFTHANVFVNTAIKRKAVEVMGEGGQLRPSHLTPATPSAGQGFGSDLAILGANSRRE